MHGSPSSNHRTRALRTLATPLCALRGVSEPGAWLRLAGTAAGEQAAGVRLVLFHGLPRLRLGARQAVHHG